MTEPNSWVRQIAMRWWQQYRARYGPNGDSEYEFQDDRVGDIAMALFESVFTLDIAIESFAEVAEGPTELAFIGTDLLEDAGDVLGMKTVLQVLDDVDLPRASVEYIRSGINPSLLPGD